MTQPSETNTPPISRRRFFSRSATLTAAAALGTELTWSSRRVMADDREKQRPMRIAAVNTVYTYLSHAYHIAGRFLHGYSIEGFHHQPPFEVVRMYNDQYPEGDRCRDLSKQFGFEISETVAGALGGDELDVDAVLLIGEHGNYPENERGQRLYPRHRLFMEIVDVFRKSGRGVPVFNDKHLSYDHRLAAEMVAASRELGFGFMAGSSLPVTWRRPELEPPLETPFTEGLASWGGNSESYAFHALETLQSMMERRRGGETGVKSVRCLKGPEVWKAGDAGQWSWDLLEAALARSPSRNFGDVRDIARDPMAILIEYADGTRGATLGVPQYTSDFAFAGRIAGRDRPVSSHFVLPRPPGARFFDPLVFNIEKFFSTGKPTYPVERTLLTSTVLDLAMHSLAAGGERIDDSALRIVYDAPKSSGFFRGRFTDAG